MRPYSVTIPSASVEEFAVVGNYIRLKTASVPVTFVVEETGESIELEQGDAANLSAFKRVKVLHASGASQSIVFYVGNGTSADSAKVGGSVSVSGGSVSVSDGSVSVSGGSISVSGGSISVPGGVAVNSFAGVSLTSTEFNVTPYEDFTLLAQNSSRRFLFISCSSGSGAINFGAAAGDMDTLLYGYRMSAGAVLLLDVTVPTQFVRAMTYGSFNLNVMAG